ncbi:Uncharacterised protein [Shewanella morhuae]|uniref:General secretion pathway, M protein n=2 Tax=Shewanella morhuae TaxID=365591 RepID=A0A380A6N4_9GAMM|nr:Uncharacterised protein [Shewanella morhuae]
MEALKKHPSLIVLIALLCVIKFIVVPITEWQALQVADIRLLNKRIVRAESALMQQAQNTEALSQLQLRVTSNNGLLYPHESENTFQLQIQQKIEELLAQYQLKSTNIGWLRTEDIKEYQVIRYQLQVRFEGPMVYVPSFQLALEQLPQWIEVSQFTAGLRYQSSTSLGDTNGMFVLDFFMEQSH